MRQILQLTSCPDWAMTQRNSRENGSAADRAYLG